MTLQLNEDDIAVFKIPEDSILETRGKKIGRIAGGLVWNEGADYYLTSFKPKLDTVKKIGGDKMIVDFYMWDAGLTPFFNKAKSIQKFKELQKMGIKICNELDFSVWYDKAKIINLYNMHYVNKRTRDMIRLGFKVTINFNMIHSDYFEIWDYYLPKKVNTIIYDNNHKMNKMYIKKDFEALDKFYKSGRSLGKVIFIDGKRNHDYLLSIISLLEKNNTEYCFIPPRIILLTMLQNKKARLMKIYKEG